LQKNLLILKTILASSHHFHDLFCNKIIVNSKFRETKIEALEAFGTNFSQEQSKASDKIEIGLTFWFLSIKQR
jgi:hypothetical protein